jgi:hypothetical protein
MVVLTVQAIEGAGVIEDRKILVPKFRPSRDRIFGITNVSTRWTHEVGNAIGRKRVVVVREIPFLGPSALERAPDNLPDAAIS